MVLSNLPKLQGLIEPTLPNHHWKVEGNAIVQVQGEKESIDNAVDLIRSVRFTNDVMRSEEGARLDKSETKRIYTPLTEASIMVQAAIEKLPFWKRVYLAVWQFIFTGTTLSKATSALQSTVVNVKHIDNEYAAKLAYPTLMADAELALTDLASYRQVAKSYILPQHLQQSIAKTACERLTNGIIYHLRQTVMQEWKEARRLMRDGHAFDTPEVMNHYDKAMQVGLILAKLAIKHELQEIQPAADKLSAVSRAVLHFMDSDTPKQRLAKLLAAQGPGGYPYFIVAQISRLYSELRSCPTYISGRLQAGFKENRSLVNQFYEEGTRPHLWNKAYNEFCHFLAEHVDIQTFKGLPRYEMSFYVGGDETMDTCDPSLLKYNITDDDSLFRDWGRKSY